MNFLGSQMVGLKLRILDKVVQAADNSIRGDIPSTGRMKRDKMAVCKAVEDRICKRIDLASRTDLTAQEVMDALRLLLKIVRQSDLPVDFSSAEILLLTRGFGERWREGKTGRCERATIRF
jgi:hypothetical protein